MRRLLAPALLVLNAVVWLSAGYRIGLARGLGWVAAMVESGCVLQCPQITVTSAEVPHRGGELPH